ncbi:MAG: single-stranded-DNA-specific exonuclease RecJ [Eubacteriales bacterium]|nr:single-stranded-DNA-specific exonuclease RecJ [Eubacteriales bacterium]
MKKWTVSQLNKDTAMMLSQSLDIPMLLAVLLTIRGIDTCEKAEKFLSDAPLLSDPFDAIDMDKAVERIKEAVENGEKICVYGDYDADGVTATALLYSYLNAVGADVDYYIPSRADEGYGMNPEAILRLHDEGVTLIITVDNGVSATDEIKYANCLGMDTVVTDHHTVPETLPDAVAVVDLHREDCPSTFKELSGVGVALKLVMAIEGEYSDVDSILDEFSDLAALGTIGDIVSLTDENRVIVKRGIESIKNTQRVGIKALLQKAGCTDKPINAGTLAYTVVPRINAVGRLGLSSRSVELLLTEDEQKAALLSETLTEDNSTRQQIEKDILSQIDERIKQDPALTMQNIIIIDGDNWHQGVIGIVAARVKAVYGKPTIIISRDGDTARGSGRSVEGFSLSDAIFNCSSILTHFGGHPMAVGFSLQSENIEAFKEALYDYTDAFDEMPLSTVNLDCKLNPGLLDISLLDSISALEPFGADNPSPVFGLYNVKITDIKELSGGKHQKLTLCRGENSFTAMCFNMETDTFNYTVGDTVDLAVTLDRNDYAGNTYLSVIVKELKLSSTDNEAMLKNERIFERFLTGKSLTTHDARSILPQREDFAAVYRYLRANNGFSGTVSQLAARLDVMLGKLRIVLMAMSELSLIEIEEGMQRTSLRLLPTTAKVSLDSAPIIAELKEMCI